MSESKSETNLETKIAEKQTKRKFTYNFYIDKLQVQIKNAKKDQTHENLKEILDTLQENDILTYELTANKQIKILNFKNPPDYMKAVRRYSGVLEVRKNKGDELFVYFREQYNYSSIKLKSENIWKLLIDVIIEYTKENDLEIEKDHENTNKNCNKCGEQLIHYSSSCNDSYCDTLHSYTKCYKCNDD